MVGLRVDASCELRAARRASGNNYGFPRAVLAARNSQLAIRYFSASETSLSSGSAVTISRSGAVPTYAIGQHVVRVNVGVFVAKSAGASLSSTRRARTTHRVGAAPA